MPRYKRFTIDNGIYHVMVRGNNRENIFHDEEDFQKYFEIIDDNRKKYEIKVYHYVLMNNHVHIIMKAKEGKDLSDAMKRTGVTYARYYRKKYKGIGHLFQDRFKSYVIQEGKYLLECGRYVELNPVKANIVKSPSEYGWSSYSHYMGKKISRLVEESPEYMGLSEEKEKREQKYREYVENVELEKRNEDRFFKEGAYGSKDFIEEMKLKGLKSKWSHGGSPGRREKS